MYRFWSRLAVELGKRAGLVSLIGLLVTLILGFGITRLDFATGPTGIASQITNLSNWSLDGGFYDQYPQWKGILS